jgi:serine/threonine-protein kinase
VLLTGQSPEALYDRYNKRWRWPEYVSLSPRLTKVLERMLAPKVGDRYSSAKSVKQALSTPDTYTVPAYPSGSSYGERTVAVSPGMGATPPSTIAAPPAPAPKPTRRRSTNLNGCFQALFGLILLIGSIGLVWWIASRWDPTGSVPNADADNSENIQSDDESSNPTYSPEEQARKNAIRERLEALQIENRYLVSVTDQLFYDQFPEQQGQALSDRPEDADLRTAWDSIANEVLDVLENNLSADARRRLGSYSASNRQQWREQVNQRYVSSRALYDLTDAKFAYLYPQNAAQDFIDQPVGQIWHGLAYDRVQSILSGERLEEIQFASGEFSRSLRDRLAPGEGRVYTINLSENQLLRVNLQAPPDATRLSLYVPSPNDEVPYLLEDSRDRTWAGELPQTGYYEVSIVNTQNQALDYALDVGADNVISTPAAPAAPEEKD